MNINNQKPVKPRTTTNETSYEVRGSSEILTIKTKNTPKPQEKK